MKWENAPKRFVPITTTKTLPMTLSYKTTTKEGSLRTIHIIVIDGERLETTREKRY